MKVAPEYTDNNDRSLFSKLMKKAVLVAAILLVVVIIMACI
jgi:hypothetical protein